MRGVEFHANSYSLKSHGQSLMLTYCKQAKTNCVTQNILANVMRNFIVINDDNYIDELLWTAAILPEEGSALHYIEKILIYHGSNYSLIVLSFICNVHLDILIQPFAEHQQRKATYLVMKLHRCH